MIPEAGSPGGPRSGKLGVSGKAGLVRVSLDCGRPAHSSAAGGTPAVQDKKLPSPGAPLPINVLEATVRIVRLSLLAVVAAVPACDRPAAVAPAPPGPAFPAVGLAAADLDGPLVRIRAAYPGASAQVVDEAVRSPLFVQVEKVEGLTRFEAESRADGTCRFDLGFAPGTDPADALARVNNRVKSALPQLSPDVRQEGVTVELRDPRWVPRLWPTTRGGSGGFGGVARVGVRVTEVPPEQQPVCLALIGENPADVRAWADAVAKRAAANENVSGPAVWPPPPEPRLLLLLDRKKAADLGVSLDDVETTIRTSVGPARFTDLGPDRWDEVRNRTTQVTVPVRSGAEADKLAEVVRKLQVRAGDRAVPLGTILSVQSVTVPAVVLNVEGWPAVRVTANFAADRSPIEAAAACVRIAEEEHKRLGLSNDYKAFDRSPRFVLR